MTDKQKEIKRNNINLLGCKFGKLTVLEKGCIKNHRTKWVVKCECGRKKVGEKKL